MSDVNVLFIAAARGKFRFAANATGGSQLSVEDLWDLPLTGRGPNLDDIARTLHHALKEADGDISFVKPAVKTTATIQAKFDIVKYVLDVKMAERDARAVAEAKAAMKQKLLSKLSEKQDKDLDSKSAEEIQAMIDQL